MKLLVNGLSANHPSGRHVLYGHLRQLANWTVNEHDYLVLVAPGAGINDGSMGENVSFLTVPSGVSNPIKRMFWERRRIPKIIHDHNVDLYFTPAGTSLSICPVRQVSLAQNPWCMADTVPKRGKTKWIAMLQRRAYARAQRSVDLMTYNSQFMQQLYNANAGATAENTAIVYQGISQETHDQAANWRNAKVDPGNPAAPPRRSTNTIVCLSVMARWKGADRLVRSLLDLKNRGVRCKLRLVGPWPDQHYRAEVERLIRKLQLENQVVITGRVSKDQLHRELAAARVYALPSTCESFGIPAVEAQAFGTPVVGSNTTAMAEIGGDGGDYCDPLDQSRFSSLLEKLMTDESYWQNKSTLARENAARFTWEQCSRPLLRMFELGCGRGPVRA